MADHLSRLTIAHDSHSPPINDEFLEECLFLAENSPWYAHIANYLTWEVLVEWKAQDKKYFFAKIHSYYWVEPFFFFKYCADQIIRGCVPEEEQ